MLGAALGLLANPGDGAPTLVRRLALVFVVLGLAWAALLTGVAFGVIGVYLWLSTMLVGAAAAAITAAIAIAVGLAGFRLASRIQRPGAPETAATSVPVALIQRYPLESAGAALLAGLVVSGSPATREVLTHEMVAFIARQTKAF